MERSTPSAQPPLLLGTSQMSALSSGELLGKAPPPLARPPACARAFTFLTTAARRAVGSLEAAAPEFVPPTPGKEVKSQNILGRCYSPRLCTVGASTKRPLAEKTVPAALTHYATDAERGNAGAGAACR